MRSPNWVLWLLPSTAWGQNMRSKSFHDAYYGAMGRDNTLPSQIAGMKDLGTLSLDRYRSCRDLRSLGRRFCSRGRDVPLRRILQGRHFGIGEPYQRLYEDDFGERYQGPLVRTSDNTDNYAAEANQNQAKNLRGKLLLMTGTLDHNVPPDNTYLVVDALIKANKDFDLIIIPNAGHGYGTASNYGCGAAGTISSGGCSTPLPGVLGESRRRWSWGGAGLTDPRRTGQPGEPGTAGARRAPHALVCASSLHHNLIDAMGLAAQDHAVRPVESVEGVLRVP